MKYIAFLSLILLFGCHSQNNNPVDLIITNVNVINIVTGNITENQDVLIIDSTIVALLGRGENTRIYKERIDGTGKYLIPGFWDMHVHLQDSSYLNILLDYGIVGVRDMGGCIATPTNGCESLCPEILNAWKEKIRNGEIIGPELYISGPPLSGTGWPTSLSAISVDEVHKNFDILINKQIDFIKVYEKIPAESYREIARLCKLKKVDFAGHVSESLLLSEVSEMGQKSIEHIREPILYCFTKDPDELELFMKADSYSQEDRDFVKPWIDDADKAIEAFKRNKTWFVPTMAIQFARQRYDDSTWIYNPLRKQLPESVNNGLKMHLERMENNPDKKGDSLWWMAHKKLVKRFSDEGIGLLAGSDMACEGGIPGLSLHEELKFMVEAGLSPLKALQTATINPTKYFELSSAGEIKENFIADLILLEKNPLVSIENTLTINLVIRKGKIYKK